MEPGERFVVFVTLVVIFSYATPWPWFVDLGALLVTFTVGTFLTMQERRTW